MSEQKIKCPTCAEEISGNETVCPFCRERLTRAPESESPESESEIRLYPPNEAALFSLFLTPVFGAFIIWSNWRNLKRQEEEKKSRIWLIVLSAVLVIALLFLNGFVCIGISLCALAVWYFKECSVQMNFLQDNKIDFHKNNWKTIVIKAAVIFICLIALCRSIDFSSGGPELDCSGNQAFMESGKNIREFLISELDIARIAEKAKYGDETKADEEILEKVHKVRLFLDNNRPRDFSKRELKKINGMSAMQLLKYVDKEYTLNRYNNVLQKRK